MGSRTLDAGESATIPVTEEELVVGKRPVQRGRVRVYGRVTDAPAEQQVELRDERITVDRRPVNRPLTDRDKIDNVLIEVTEVDEEAVVGKQERVVGEIVVGKTSEKRTETVRDTVRRRDVDVDRDDAGVNNDERRR